MPFSWSFSNLKTTPRYFEYIDSFLNECCSECHSKDFKDQRNNSPVLKVPGSRNSPVFQVPGSGNSPAFKVSKGRRQMQRQKTRYSPALWIPGSHNSLVFKIHGSQFKIGITSGKRHKNSKQLKNTLLGPECADWWKKRKKKSHDTVPSRRLVQEPSYYLICCDD